MGTKPDILEGKALANTTLGQVESVRTQSGQVISGIVNQGEWIREGATVIDVGINRLPDGSI